MIRTTPNDFPYPVVMPVRSHRNKRPYVGILIGHESYYLTPDEAFRLSNDLVDAAEESESK
jgi:hypothetical protein